MNLDQFQASLDGDQPPEDFASALLVLWYEAKGQWERAHQIAQSMSDPEGAILHAFLHRVEGDLSNAGYWYRRAGQAPFEGSLQQERETLLQRFL
ncbi:MAG: hypothetical protein DWQ01_02085 [Planctomycetota bacterium]|nr:MAG: hypothetical protein DWQ01_02085 [Planctomycetota bacterium]